MLFSLPNIKNFYFNFVQFYIISFFDFFSPLLGLNHGFDFIQISNLDRDLINYFSPLLHYNLIQNKKYVLSDDDIYFASNLVLPHVHDLIRGYLGRFSALDALSLHILYPDDSTNTSGLPHHDSVGHRLKLFVPLRLNQTMLTPTMYINNSHYKKWRRFSNPVRPNQSRIDTFWDLADVSTLLPRENNAYIFDTNGVHWGSYSGIVLPRVYLTFEFSTIKSYMIRGKIGPSLNYHSRLRRLLRKYNLLPYHLSFQFN